MVWRHQSTSNLLSLLFSQDLCERANMQGSGSLNNGYAVILDNVTDFAEYIGELFFLCSFSLHILSLPLNWFGVSGD